MNIWECLFPECGLTVAGLGGAIGLRAIGWYYRKGAGFSGPTIMCPRHRADMDLSEAEDNAKAIQRTIGVLA